MLRMQISDLPGLMRISRRVRQRATWLTCALAIIMPGVAAAQSAGGSVPFSKRQLVGVVRDAAGATLADVTVAIPGSTTRTNARGAFELLTTDIDTVTISLRHIGFEAVDALLTARNKMWDTVLVQLSPTARSLETVNVKGEATRKGLGLRDFEERRARGLGSFITRSEIVERGAFRLSDLLRSKRGVNVVKGGLVRFVSSSGSRRLCQPDIWLDGARSLPMEVDELPSMTVEAMELYANFSTVPIEFQRIGANTTPCGTIVIWTRIPNAKNK